MSDLDALIVGGGIHGVHLAVRWIAEGKLPPERLAIVDPAPQLLARSQQNTTNTGMVYLRSPGVHHLDVDPWSLLRFGGHGRKDCRHLFTAPYDRPATELFAAHAADVIARHGLADRHLTDAVAAIDPGPADVTVRLVSGATRVARRVVLAIGASEQPYWPDGWQEAWRDAGVPVQHVFAAPLDVDAAPARVAVIGAGITGAQLALRLAAAGREVHLLARHPLRVHDFDSDPGWIGPKHMRAFAGTRDPAARRRQISAARHRGSMPPDVHRQLRAALDAGHVQFHRSACIAPDAAGVRTDRGPLPVDAVWLATGFAPRRPGGALVDDLVARHGLPCAACGYPLVDRFARWHPRIHVSGPLAELELGPTARNIIGARRAAERVLAAVRA